ncbi:uncharacterized protein [Drosophila bipectinata]|uniref:uncharacterized protein n=1 Tax=Drosophila bipectinata TaxID=42026 RepID=UPI0038B2A771
MRNNRPSHGRVHPIVPVVSPKKSVDVVINGRSCQFEVNSVSPVTIMKESSYRYIWPNGNPDLVKCHLKLSEYQRNPIRSRESQTRQSATTTAVSIIFYWSSCPAPGQNF